MNIQSGRLRVLCALGALLTTAATASAQAPAASPATAVMVSLTVKADIDRAQLMQVMPQEVRDTVLLYLDGKIQQWYSRADGRGVMFILNCTTAAEAKALMDTLPLAKNNLANFEFTPLGPLTPLRLLVAAPAVAPKNPQ